MLNSEKEFSGKAILSVFLISVLCFTSIAEAEDIKKEPPEAAFRAAETGLKKRLSTLSEDYERAMGFYSKTDIEKATVGKPYQEIYLVNRKKMNSTSSLSDVLKISDYWIFPVLVDEEVRCLLWVAQLDGVWRVSKMGGAPLAKRLNVLNRNIFSKKNKLGFLRGMLVHPRPDIVLIIFSDGNRNWKFFPVYPNKWQDDVSLQSAKITLIPSQAGEVSFSFSQLKEKFIRRFNH
ncbi:MAG: hypothetical protein GY854_26375 [Deltaproteobacteria bacterium]|nr:hypothetical protein [Deltaproteobacteria bacterium]